MQKITKAEFVGLPVEQQIEYINGLAAGIGFLSRDFYPDGVITKQGNEYVAAPELRIHLAPPVEEKLLLLAENMEIYLAPNRPFLDPVVEEDKEE